MNRKGSVRPGHCPSFFYSILQSDLSAVLVDVRHQSAGGDHFLEEIRKRLSLEGLSGRLVGDESGIEVHLYLVALGDGLCGLRCLDDREADVQRVPIEDAREALGDDTADAAGLKHLRCVLTGGAAAEVLATDDDVACIKLLQEVLVDVLHRVARQLLLILNREISSRDDDIRIDIVAIF